MTLDEAIKHCNEIAAACDNELCACDHKQLAEWLTELKKKSWQPGHPEEDGAYLVCEIRTYKENKWLEEKILTWNKYYECWDGEDGDDFYCKPEQVQCWMPLPTKPELE
jgi:hypothetical protein